MKSKNIILKKMNQLNSLIGNTPLLEISYCYKGEKRQIYAKSEHYNLTGSIKDRMALHVLRKAYEKGSISPGDRIIEATSGNTGIAFSAIGRFLGHPVTIFMPDWMSRERINLIKSYGAEIILVSKEQGGFLGSIKMADKLAEELGAAFRPQQFKNADNADTHYNSTGPEIYMQLEKISKRPNAFVAGVGTGGTVMGVGRYLKKKNISTAIYPLEPSNSPTLSTGCKVGNHRIQGISDEFIPAIVNLDSLDKVLSVDDGDSIIMAQKLAFDLGIGIGTSSGANFLGAVIAQNELGSNSIITTVFSDDNKKYLSTDLARTEPVKEGFISTNIELISVQSLNRLCEICNKDKVLNSQISI